MWWSEISLQPDFGSSDNPDVVIWFFWSQGASLHPEFTVMEDSEFLSRESRMDCDVWNRSQFSNRDESLRSAIFRLWFCMCDVWLFRIRVPVTVSVRWWDCSPQSCVFSSVEFIVSAISSLHDNFVFWFGRPLDGEFSQQNCPLSCFPCSLVLSWRRKSVCQIGLCLRVQQGCWGPGAFDLYSLCVVCWHDTVLAVNTYSHVYWKRCLCAIHSHKNGPCCIQPNPFSVFEKSHCSFRIHIFKEK